MSEKKCGRKKKNELDRTKVYSFCVRPTHEPIIREFIKDFKKKHGYEIHEKKQPIINKPQEEDWAIGKL